MNVPKFNKPNFVKPQSKLGCEHFRHIVQRLKIVEEPGRSVIDDYNRCNIKDKRITKRECVDCKEYKPIK